MDAQLYSVSLCHPTDHCSAQDSALSGLLPQWFYPARLYFPSCLPNTVIPICISSSRYADFSLVLLLLFLLPITLPFQHLHPFFIPGVIICSVYIIILLFHLRLLAHLSRSLRTLFHSDSLARSAFSVIHPYFFPAPPLASTGAFLIHF